ncbi:MAG: TolC family protein [Gemmatimonadota bacterium]|nr:TolC family protein [Gemmatimonadota bacterium]
MKIAILLLIAGLQGTTPDTTYLSIETAIERALEANPALRAARATADAAGALPTQASQAFLPTIDLGLTGVRTNDPVAVFGLKLRQATFAMSDFDIGALNNPNPSGGWDAAVTVQMPILAPEGLFGFAAARKAARAQSAAASRAAGASQFLVIRAYWDAQLAARQVEALDSALTAVRAHRRRAQAMREQGLVTGLDERLAGLKASELEVQRLATAALAANAVGVVRAMLVLPEGDVIVLTDSLRLAAPGGTCAAADATCVIDQRGDLEAFRLGEAAARLGVKRAWASQLPAVAVFGTLAHRTASAPFSAGSGDWTVGVGVTWPILRGLAGVGAVRAAKAEHRAASARREAAERQAALEITQASDMLEAARQRVDVAARAEVEAREALEQARLRYRTGAAPITELLDVQAATTTTTLHYLAARRDLFVASAALDLAYGVNDQ